MTLAHIHLLNQSCVLVWIMFSETLLVQTYWRSEFSYLSLISPRWRMVDSEIPTELPGPGPGLSVVMLLQQPHVSKRLRYINTTKPKQDVYRHHKPTHKHALLTNTPRPTGNILVSSTWTPGVRFSHHVRCLYCLSCIVLVNLMNRTSWFWRFYKH